MIKPVACRCLRRRRQQEDKQQEVAVRETPRAAENYIHSDDRRKTNDSEH